MVTSKPLVSATICFLNAERFLRDAVESIRAQTYDNWELHLVDDGSRDGSTELARGFARREPRKIHYWQHEGHKNRGLSASRNAGIAHSRGKYLAFLDADDTWFPHKLEKQVKLMEENPDIDVYVNPGLYSYDDGARQRQPMTLPPGRISGELVMQKILEHDINTPLPSCILVRRELFAQFGGFADWAPNMVEDQVMCFRVGFRANFFFDPECLTTYRVHPSSLCMGTPTEKAQLAQIRLYAWVIHYLRRQGRQGRATHHIAKQAQYRLYSTLLEHANHVEDGVIPTDFKARAARFYRDWERLRPHLGTLGPALSCLFLLKGVSWRAAQFVRRLTRVPAELVGIA
jgi:glycosyltransferase involved in cell wall biosynthesis